MFICWCVYAWILHLIQYNTIYDQRKFGWQKSGGSGGTFFSKWSNSRWHKIKRADLVLVLVLGELTPATWICGYTRKLINFYSTQGVDSINPVLTWRYDLKIWNDMRESMISGWRRAFAAFAHLDFHVFGQAQPISRTGCSGCWRFFFVVGRSLDEPSKYPQPSRTVHLRHLSLGEEYKQCIYTHYIESSMSIILNKHFRNESCYGHEASRTSASILWISFGCALAHLDLHVMNSSMNQWMQQMQYIFESQGWTSVQSSDMLRSRTHPWSMNLPAKVVFKVWLFMHVAPAQWASVFDVSSCMVCCSYWVLECYSCYSVYLWIAWLL